MKLRDPDSPARRIAIAIGTGIGIAVLIGAVYFVAGPNPPGEKVNGIHIVAAARAYSRKFIAAGQPVPKTVSLDELISSGFLKSEDVAAFKGMNATVILVGADAGPQTVLMRLHMPDGTDMALLADGSVRQVQK